MAEKRVTTVDLNVEGRDGRVVPVRHYGPALVRGSTESPVVWVHGGAFVGGGLNQRESHAVALAVADTGRAVVTVDYRLAPAFNWVKPLTERNLRPGQRFPAALNDVSDVFRWVHDRTGRAILGGASAGAALSASATLRALRMNAPFPETLVLAYGTFRAELPPVATAIRQRIRGVNSLVQFRPRTVANMNLNYAGSVAALSDPLAFPGGADVFGFPPTLLVDADRDSLRSSGERFANELAAAGVHTDHHVVANSRHGFLDRPGSAAFAAGIEIIVGWLAAGGPVPST